MDYASMSPREVRALIREGKITGPTAGMCVPESFEVYEIRQTAICKDR